jgi:ABC-2 type transport system permease protein
MAMSSVPVPTRPGRSSLAQWVCKWWTFFQISLNERLVYRGDFMLGTLMRFLPTLTQIFLWWAIFETLPGGTSNTSNAAGQIAGYRYGDMVAYYLMVTIGRAFSSMPGLTTGITRMVRSGEVKKFLIQPIDLIGSLLMQRVAHKLVYYMIATIPFALVFVLCRGYFLDGWPDAERMIVFFASLLLAFLLGYFVEACLGLASFWLLEVSSLAFIYMLLNFLMSGHMFPLELLPTWMKWLVDILPLKYLAYFPAAVFLEKVDRGEMYWGLMIEAAWVVAFIGLARIMWARGVKRYSGFGG